MKNLSKCIKTMGSKKSKALGKSRSVYLLDEHRAFVDKHDLNLSMLLRDILNEMILKIKTDNEKAG